MNGAPSASAAPAVWKTIFLAEIDSTLAFSLVEYADGQLDVLRNGRSISPSPWSSEDLVNCVRTFQKVSRIAAAARAGQSHRFC
jgi:hypothetical protein